MPTFPLIIITAKPSKLIPGEIGLFALRNLKKGTIINKAFACGEKFFSKYVYDKLDNITKNAITTYCTKVYDGFFSIPDLNYLPLQSFCNHSCEPSCGFDAKGNSVLIRNVRKGEEITIDYGFMNTDPKYRLQCLCGSKKCRKIITGNDWKNPEYYKKNRKYMAV
jgi:SET domain-containing protein